MEPTPFRRTCTAADLPLQETALPAFFRRIGDWHRLQQCLRVWMHRMMKDILRVAILHDLAKIHNRNLVTHVIDRPQSVPHKQKRQPKLLLQFFQQI